MRYVWCIVCGVLLAGTGVAHDGVHEILEPVYGLELRIKHEPERLTELFESFNGVQTDSDGEWFYIASNGLPDHSMMVGITNWQQQLPIPQQYTHTNQWQIPLYPTVAERPTPVANRLYSGAIAIAVNGIPIFHPMTTSGDDAYASGQLDRWGGHAGRADDYHYHIPPLHLQEVVGDAPIAYALDGFPLYGTTTLPLDANLGRWGEDGLYHYHSISSYPYLIANMVGKVNVMQKTERQQTIYQIVPQPKTEPVRPATAPLNGSHSITNFTPHGSSGYQLIYMLNGGRYAVDYRWNASGRYSFTFTDPNGNTSTENYRR